MRDETQHYPPYRTSGPALGDGDRLCWGWGTTALQKRVGAPGLAPGLPLTQVDAFPVFRTQTSRTLPEAIITPALLFLAGLVAGMLNVIAGGGSLLTLPVMIFLGLPPTVANGTNRVAILIQNVGAVWSFQKRRLISREWVLLSVPPSILGVLLGTFAAIQIGELAFQRILAVILVGAALWSVLRSGSPPADTQVRSPEGSKRWAFAGLFFLIGAYGGFVQAGVGFIILAVTSAGGLNLIRGNAVKVTLILAFTVPALILFASSGKVDWAMGLALAAGNFLGALAGVRLQVLKGQAWVQKVVAATIVLFSIRLLFWG